MRYALIKGNVIDNIIMADYYNADQIKVAMGYDYAINVDNYPVGIGDIYENGSFLTGVDIRTEDGTLLIPKGTVIERDLSQEEKFSMLEIENVELKNKVAEQDVVIEELMFGIIPNLIGGM